MFIRGVLAITGVALLSGASPAIAQPQLSIAPTGGALRLDPDLDNYRWEQGAQPMLGATLRAHWDRWAAGLRWTRTTTTQATGIPGDTRAPSVRMTSIQLVGEARLWQVGRTELRGALQGGWLHLGYAPDRLELDVGGSSVEVEYQPIDEWIGGASLGLAHPLPKNLSLALWTDFSAFSLDTAHRDGDVIEAQRETFGNWSLRLEATWSFWP